MSEAGPADDPGTALEDPSPVREQAAERAPDGQPEQSGSTGLDAATGDPRVDDAVSRLAEVDALPLAEQVEVFTDIHRRLAAVLADPDSRG